MKILITGANGQLGQAMRQVLSTEHPDVTAIYATHEMLDMTDASAVERFIADNDVTYVVNCAAYTAVDRAEDDKAQCTAVNVDGVKNLAFAADNVGAKVIHISTDYVFDGKSYRPYHESDKVSPCSHYGATKRMGETALLALAPDSIVIRTGWLYSQYAHNFVKTILRKSRELPQLKVVCDQVGTPTYAVDLARAIVKIIRSPQWVQGIYHYSNSGVCSWYDFAKAIMEFGGTAAGCKLVPILTEDYPTAATRPYYSVLDKSRIRLTYAVEVPHWIDSLKECIKQL
jgi:dTDP-4-dehydrorhamnose reductase